MVKQDGLGDPPERYASLSASGDSLGRLSEIVDFEIIQPGLVWALGRKDRSRGGRPPMDAVMMFEILVLQAFYGLSDEQAEFQVRDCLSLMRFLGLRLSDPVPDQTINWLFREALGAAGAMDGLFGDFDMELTRQGFAAMRRQIIEAPRQRLTRNGKQSLRDSNDPGWPPAKKRQKDIQARLTMKRGRVKAKFGTAPVDGSGHERVIEGRLIPAFGYKSQVNIDLRHGLIHRFTVIDAAWNDGGQLPTLLQSQRLRQPGVGGHCLSVQDHEDVIEEAGRRSMIHFRKLKGKPILSATAEPTARAPKSARWSSVCSPPRRPTWGCSSAPSVWPGAP